MPPLKESVNLQMSRGTQMSNLIEIATVEFRIGQWFPDRFLLVVLLIVRCAIERSLPSLKM